MNPSSVWLRVTAASLALALLAGCRSPEARPAARRKPHRTGLDVSKLPRGPGIGRPGENPRPGSLASAVASGKLEGKGLPPAAEYSAGPAEEIPKAPERAQARTLQEAKERALADLVSPNAHLRFVAALEAGALGLAEAVPILAELVSRDDAAAAAAVRSLGRIGGDDAARALGSRLGRTRDAAFDLEVIRALGRTRSRLAFKPLARALEDEKVSFQLAAAHALGELGRPEAAGALRRALERAGNVPALRVAISTALARLGDLRGVEILDEAVSRGSPDLQAVAVAGLAAIAAGNTSPGGSEESARLRTRAAWRIASALGSPYPEAWRAAFAVLVRMHPAEAQEVLAAMENASPQIAARSRLVRAAFGGAGSREAISAGLLDPDPHLRAAACEAIAVLGDCSIAELAARALDDPQPFVRVAGARALGALGGEFAAKTLQQTLSRDDPALRAAAMGALASMRSRPEMPGGSAAGARAERASAGVAVAGFSLEGVVRGAGGEHLCVLRSPEGKAMLLREGEAAGDGYVVERILAGGKGKPRVVLSRDGSAIELEAP